MTPETQTALRERLRLALRGHLGPNTRKLVEEALALLPPEPAAGQAQEPSEWKPDVALAIEACRDLSLPDGACRFAVLSCLVQQPPLTEEEMRWAQDVATRLDAPQPVPAQDGPAKPMPGESISDNMAWWPPRPHQTSLVGAQDGPEPSVERCASKSGPDRCEKPAGHNGVHQAVGACWSFHGPAPALPPHQDVPAALPFDLEVIAMHVAQEHLTDPDTLVKDEMRAFDVAGLMDVATDAIRAALARRAPADQGQREDSNG